MDGMTHLIITEAGPLAAAFKTGQILMANYGTSTINTLQAVQLAQDMVGELTVHFAGPSGLRGLYVMVKRYSWPKTWWENSPCTLPAPVVCEAYT